MIRVAALSAALLISTISVYELAPAHARTTTPPAPTDTTATPPTSKPCAPPTTIKQKVKRGLFGKVIGTLSDRTIGRTSVAPYIPYNTAAEKLTDAIACKLDGQEQKKAAAATDRAVQRGALGQSESWTSDTRANVSGTSTVTGKSSRMARANGEDCMTVEDVVSINGEDTIATKRMCRAKGQSGYVVVAT